MIHLPVAQGSEEWHMARCGLPTASNFHRIITPRGAISSGRDRYLWDLLAETILGHPLETFTSTAMNRGTKMEAEAVAAYELARSVDTEVCGLCLTEYELVGASPDRLIKLPDGKLAGVEIKCPFEPGIHMGYLLGGLANKHVAQTQGQIQVAELAWSDIVSYHPDLPMAIVRADPWEDYQKLLREALAEFTAELAALVARAHEQGWIKEPAPEPEVGDLGITDEDVEAVVAAVTGKE